MCARERTSWCTHQCQVAVSQAPRFVLVLRHQDSEQGFLRHDESWRRRVAASYSCAAGKAHEGGYKLG